MHPIILPRRSGFQVPRRSATRSKRAARLGNERRHRSSSAPADPDSRFARSKRLPDRRQAPRSLLETSGIRAATVRRLFSPASRESHLSVPRPLARESQQQNMPAIVARCDVDDCKRNRAGRQERQQQRPRRRRSANRKSEVERRRRSLCPFRRRLFARAGRLARSAVGEAARSEVDVLARARAGCGGTTSQPSQRPAKPQRAMRTMESASLIFSGQRAMRLRFWGKPSDRRDWLARERETLRPRKLIGRLSCPRERRLHCPRLCQRDAPAQQPAPAQTHSILSRTNTPAVSTVSSGACGSGISSNGKLVGSRSSRAV